MSHTCHARGCEKIVPPRMLFCVKHWRMTPRLIQARIWKHYRPGQEITKDPSIEYLAVMKQAIDTVAELEGVR